MSKVHYTFGESREIYRDGNGYRLEHYRTACGLWLPNEPHYMVFAKDDCDCKRCLGVLERLERSGIGEQRYVRRRMRNGRVGVFLRDGSSAPLPGSVVGGVGGSVGSSGVVGEVLLKSRSGTLWREQDDK